jgi:hypothetical protein
MLDGWRKRQSSNLGRNNHERLFASLFAAAPAALSNGPRSFDGFGSSAVHAAGLHLGNRLPGGGFLWQQRDAMVRLLGRVVGVGVETADMLVQEVFAREIRDRKALARALSDQFFGSSLAASQAMSNPFRYFNSSPEIIRLAVREVPAVAAQRRGSVGRARDRHQP